MNIFANNEGAGGGVPSRDQIAAADTWDLSPLYANDAAWEADFSVLQEQWPGVGAFKGRVAESAQTLCEVLEFEKALNLRIEQLYHYASLRVAEDSSSAENLRREGVLQNLLTKIGEAASYITPEIQALDDAVFDRYLGDPVLQPWRIALRKIRRLKPHTLTSGEERLMALSGMALYGHCETFNQLTNVDMKFGTLKDEKGEERELTQSSFSSMLVKRDPALRKAAFHQFYREFSDHQYTVASTLSSSVRSDVFRARARNYASAREAALFADEMPVSVYDNLIGSVRANLAPLFRYYELRRKVLQLDEIHHYDT